MNIQRRLGKLLLAVALAIALLLVAHGIRAIQSQGARFQQDPSLVATATALAASVVPGPAGDSLPTQSSCLSAATNKELERNLAAIDTALAGMTGDGNRFLDALYHVDRQRFHDRIAAAASDCVAVLRVTRLFAANGGAALRRALEWRERAPRRLQEGFGSALARVDARDFSRPNPWRPLPGCVLIGAAAWPQAHGEALCAGRPVAGAEAVPPDAGELLAALSRWTGKAEGNTLPVLGHSVPQGGHVALTLQAAAQAGAQLVARCYTGDDAACLSAGIDPASWQHRYERAAVRAVGIVQLDIASGAVEVLASGMSRCYRQDHDGPGRDADCPALPTEPAARPDRLGNLALHGAAMPGSLVKPVLALGLLRSDLGDHLRGAGRRAFLEDIQRSESGKFMDRLFGKDKGWQDTGRLGHVEAAAAALGLNQACGSGARCGRLFPLLGNRDDWSLAGVRLLREPARDEARNVVGWRALPSDYSPEWAARCAGLGWKKCSGGQPVDLLAELWGQGHSQASPLGISGMWSRLGAAANGAAVSAAPHLVSSVTRQGQPALLPEVPAPLSIPAEDARLIVAGMQLSHAAGGTAHHACRRVFGATACDGLNQVAGKTGTPMFDDLLTLEARRQQCAALRAELARNPAPARQAALMAHMGACAMVPVKWYAALIRSDARPAAPWDKVLVVMAERNFEKDSGLVDGADKSAAPGANVAAEIAFQLIRRNFPGIQPHAGKPS